MRAVVLAAALIACRPAIAQDDVVTTANAYQPQLLVLVLRVHAVKYRLRGSLPGWQDMFRIAQLANDELGLPPFEQATEPGPGWRPSPASLLGMKARIVELARRETPDEMRALITDARTRYRNGIANVDAHLSQVERWLASRQPPAGPL